MRLVGVLQELVDLIFPPACEACSALGRLGLCERCMKQVVTVGEPLCAHCGVPFDPAVSRPPRLCSYCNSEAPLFDGARAYGLHTGPLRQAVISYKFRGRTALAPFLAALLAERVAAEEDCHWGLPLSGMDAVVPVPLHSERLRWRGFDQAALLCRHLATALEKPLWEHFLMRSRSTLPQVGLNLDQRRENVRNAFEVTDAAAILGRRLLIVDDVYTTGATANDAARALKAAGADEVHLVTITRTVPDWHPAAHAVEPPEPSI